jgi:hypothetical protein
VSYARVAGRQHFPSDVLVGSMLGYWIGHDVVKRRRTEARHDASFGRFVPEEVPKRSSERTFVPLDSWVYSAFDRLAAYGLLRDESSFRPWTRLECARLVKEVSDRMEYQTRVPESVLQTFEALSAEFPEASVSHRLFPITDVYTRGQYIAGKPLTDGYHFGQTISDDYGRPNRAGASAILGAEISGGWENVGIAFRGEYQHGNSQNISSTTAALIDGLDRTPGMVGPIFVPQYPRFDAFVILDSYLTTELAGLTLTLGKQTLAWGPSETSPMLMGENAQPMPMLRLSREEATDIPGLSSFLGPFRTQAFIAQMDGHHNINPFLGTPVQTQPILLGQAFTFQPTENFEFGFTRTGIYGSTGLPITLGGLRNALLSSSNSFGKNDPGDRRSGLFFKYRVPFARNWATFYADSFTEDEFSPLAYPRKSAIKPGIYFSHLPKLPRVDLRIEASNTDLPSPLPLEKGFFYYNVRYVDGYENDGFLLGDSIGRQAKQVSANSSIWLSEEQKMTFGYRDRKVSNDFLPGGGTQSAGSLSLQKKLGEKLTMTGTIQIERWMIPALNPNQRWDVTSRVEMRFKGAK